MGLKAGKDFQSQYKTNNNIITRHQKAQSESMARITFNGPSLTNLC